MKLIISLAGILLLAGCQPKPSPQKELKSDFEGMITYKLVEWDPKNSDSARAALIRSYLPLDTMMVIFNEGSFMAMMDSSEIHYSYFNPHTNKEYTRLTGDDSVYMFPGDVAPASESALLDAFQENNTDTILGYACNRLTMKFKDDRTITYLYSPQLSTNPEWYKNSKKSYYNVVYKLMKSYYLSMRIEDKEHAFTLRAINVNQTELPDMMLPDPSQFLLHKSR